MNKQIGAILLGLAFLSGPASAQTAMQADKTATSVTHKKGQWRSSKVIGVNIYNESNEKIGEVDDIILDKSGKVDNVILSVGGFLGIGEHRVAIQMDKIKWINEPRNSTTATNTKTSTGTPATNVDSTTRTAADDNRATTGAARATRQPNEQWYPDHGVYNATKDQLKALPEFKY
jgi:sporulation protein YlmC with PRC-barrel domain